MNSSSRVSDVAMATVDADEAVTGALMVACDEEDVDRVKELLSVDDKVRLSSATCSTSYILV